MVIIGNIRRAIQCKIAFLREALRQMIAFVERVSNRMPSMLDINVEMLEMNTSKIDDSALFCP